MSKNAPWSTHVSFEQGELHVAGVSATELAKKFGTPAFIVDEADFRARAKSWNDALDQEFGASAGTVYYAAKAFICTDVARWIHEVGIGIDVCTGGELAAALAGGISPDQIEMHGNNKSLAEIDKGVSLGVKAIVIDSLFEIDRVASAAKRHQKVQQVLLRITPGVDVDTHENISTAHEDVKFGFSLASGAAWRAIEEVLTHPSLELRGIHAHIGSQIFGTRELELSSIRLISLLAKYRDKYKSELPDLDIGGGFGIAYLPGEKNVAPEDVLPAIGSAIRKACADLNLAVPKISIEPGRSISGPTTFTLYEVGTTKDVSLEDGTVRRYISVDGGMSDNIRPSLYSAEYTAVIAQRNSTADQAPSRIVGKHCETGDIIVRDISLPRDVLPGDLIAIPATGAYGRSMASNYNHVPRPPVIAVKDGKARVIVRRENEADLLALDVKE